MNALGLFLALSSPFFTTQPGAAEPFYGIEYVRTYDGDTFIVNIPSLPDLFGKEIPIRVAHIDAPEITGSSDCEKAAAIEAAREVARTLKRAKKLALVSPKRDKYFRILADVLVDDKLLLSDHMLKRRLAYPYEGGSKSDVNWCKYSKRAKP